MKMDSIVHITNWIFGSIAIAWLIVGAAYLLFFGAFFLDSENSFQLLRPVVLVILSIPVITLVSVVLCHFDHSKLRIIWAFLPAVPLVAGIIFLSIGFFTGVKKDQERKDFVTAISKDFTCAQLPGHLVDEFLTVDTTKGVIVHITPYTTMITADPVGRIDGSNLILYPLHESVRKNQEDFYKGCTNSNGQNLYDRYTVSWGTDDESYDIYDIARYAKRD